jgi:DegV family protein with EDD domain
VEPDTEIISIHLSSALSGTYQSALLASSMLEQEGTVTVIDSKSATYGIGMLAIAAAKAASEGKSKAEIVEMITKIRDNTRIYFIVDTLEYLQKGGRIGKAAAMFGSLLNIKPILSIDQGGEVFSVDKVRGQKRAISRMLELIAQDFGNDSIHITLEYTNNLAALEEIEQLIKHQFHVESVQYTSIGPVIGAHVGPGTSGIVITRV